MTAAVDATAHRPRLVGGLLLGTRQAAALLTRRHQDQVRRQCAPVACDLASRALLYDLDAVADRFRALPRRERIDA